MLVQVSGLACSNQVHKIKSLDATENTLHLLKNTPDRRQNQ